MKKDVKKTELVIIGAGPAGMAAAVDAENNKINFILIEKEEPGWFAKYSVNQHYKVDGYLGEYNTSGTELINNFLKHLKSKNIGIHALEIKYIEKKGKLFYIDSKNLIIETPNVILATGTNPKKLYLDNYEKFLRENIFNFVAKDGEKLKKKKVVVLGGRNSGVTTAFYLNQTLNCKVTLVEKDKKLNATKKYLLKIKDTDIKIIVDAEIVKLNGDKKLESIDLQVNNKASTILTDAMFVCIGTKPNTNLVRHLNLEFDTEKRLVVNPLTMETSISNFYAIGDINQLLPKQITNAAAQGKTAIYFINKKLQSEFSE